MRKPGRVCWRLVNRRRDADSYPALTLEEVFGAMSFYLGNRETVDDYLAKGRAEFTLASEDAQKARPALYAKLREARKNVHSTTS